jgi:hypothetical protein
MPQSTKIFSIYVHNFPLKTLQLLQKGERAGEKNPQSEISFNVRSKATAMIQKKSLKNKMFQ